jgi:hypothetical protein
MSTDTQASSFLELMTTTIAFDETDDGKQHQTHIINPPNNLHVYQPGMTSKDIVNLARMSQIFVVALCGYKFIPKRNPESHPACSACISIAVDLMRGNNE